MNKIRRPKSYSLHWQLQDIGCGQFRFSMNVSLNLAKRKTPIDSKAYTQRASSKLSHIYIDKLARYSCILFTVIVERSSRIEK